MLPYSIPPHQGSYANAWSPSPFLTLAHPEAQKSPAEKGLWLGPERGMDPSGLQGHPLPASRQGPLSTQVPLDPSGRVNTLRAEREMQKGKHTRLGENTPHTPPPLPTTRLTARTDWLLRHLQFGHQALPPLPVAVPADCLPSVPTTLHQPRHPSGTTQSLELLAVTTLPFLHSMPWSHLSKVWGSCSFAPLKCLNSRSQKHLLSHLASQPHWTNGRAQLLGGGTPGHQLNAAAALAPPPP